MGNDKQKNEIATLESTMAKIEKVAADTSMSRLEQLPQMTRAVTLAKGMQQLRQLMSGEILDTIYSLMDCNLGFRTDRAPGQRGKDGQPVKPYPKEVVRDCTIEAMLRGAYPTGNEFNIIAGRTYLTKEFYERLVREHCNDLRVVEGVPQSVGGGALVPMRASWSCNGKRDSIECVKTADQDTRIPVRVNSGMGADAIIGKAYRKLYAKIYRRVTGSTWLESEADEDAPAAHSDANVIDVESSIVEQEDTQEDATQDAGPHPMFDGIEKLLSGMDTLTAVNDYESGACAVLETDEDRARLAEWCDWRRDQIRSTRGQRANGKQGDAA